MSNQRLLNLAKNQRKQQRKHVGAKSPICLPEQEITHEELNLRNASQESPDNMCDHCKGFLSSPEKLIAGILGLICLKVTMKTCKLIFNFKNSQCFLIEIHNLSSAYHCGRCPNEWLIFSNNCYYFGVEKKTWKESVVSCMSKKSSLLYIDDVKEMKFINSLSRPSWIGVSRSSRDHPWLLVNGSMSNLQIKNSSGESNCVWLSLSHFIAGNCGSLYMYTCKRKFLN
ncbi:PREDICTED: NKG2-A/NKG2-B type II integral membrane protein-like [Chinchilla lanigera]|uniref:NKG2-A/NKG2-B type II integral membrane protein-like n=1 Tax=Chinchilla lanigera TaxID=34839 RepID=UPI00038F171E|nr:PREDICTED: NKG2-A/NKG2-B type II integral membrane protein-like [Chinchilla lanigera]